MIIYIILTLFSLIFCIAIAGYLNENAVEVYLKSRHHDVWKIIDFNNFLLCNDKDITIFDFVQENAYKQLSDLFLNKKCLLHKLYVYAAFLVTMLIVVVAVFTHYL